jgi:ATP-dependent DNA ligase
VFEAVRARELEGVAAKRRSGPYVPGVRGWAKVKNRAYWRYEMVRKSALNKPRVKQFV